MLRSLAVRCSFPLILAAGALAQSPQSDADVKQGRVGEKIAEYLGRARAQGFSGSVLAARDGEVVCAVGAGWADLQHKQALDSTALFEIASASKPITALAVVLLAKDGKLKLDDSIAKYLPGTPDDCAGIHVRHLIQHTSGIPGSNSQGAGEQLDAALKSFLRGGPQHEPGTHWEYWNQGYALLSEIVARVAGRPYVDELRRSVFEPSAMSWTCFTGDKAPKGALVAVGESARGEPRSALEHPYGAYDFRYRGMGGVVTNVWDLWRFDRALRDHRLLDETWKREVFEPGLEDYALGWRVKTGRSGRLVQSHGGSVRGFVCEVRRFPQQNGCLFVLCNRDDAPVYGVSEALESLLFNDAPKPPLPPAALDRKSRDALVGEYEAKNGRRIVIELDGELTRIRIEWSGPNGAVTRALLGRDEKGELVLFEWTATTKIEVKGKGKALVFGADEYLRKR